MSIRVIVATHKACDIAQDPLYLPVHVGAAGKEDIGFTRDDSGDNISEKNPHFCELTGLYWAWKNLDDDYIGLCHYRRYFGGEISLLQILPLPSGIAFKGVHDNPPFNVYKLR